jgi:hypothetical protein
MCIRIGILRAVAALLEPISRMTPATLIIGNLRCTNEHVVAANKSGGALKNETN